MFQFLWRWVPNVQNNETKSVGSQWVLKDDLIYSVVVPPAAPLLPPLLLQLVLLLQTNMFEYYSFYYDHWQRSVIHFYAKRILNAQKFEAYIFKITQRHYNYLLRNWQMFVKFAVTMQCAVKWNDMYTLLEGKHAEAATSPFHPAPLYSRPSCQWPLLGTVLDKHRVVFAFVHLSYLSRTGSKPA